MMNRWYIIWVMWLVFFGAIEGPALLNKNKNDTLSEFIWKFFSIKEKSRQWRFRRFCLLSFLAWLVAHLITGGQF